MDKKKITLWIVAILLVSLGAVPAFQGRYVKADGGRILAMNIDSNRFPDDVIIHLSINAPYSCLNLLLRFMKTTRCNQ